MPTILGNAARAEKDIFGNTDIGTMTVGNGDHDENYDHGPNGDHDDRVDPDMRPSENGCRIGGNATALLFHSTK